MFVFFSSKKLMACYEEILFVTLSLYILCVKTKKKSTTLTTRSVWAVAFSFVCFSSRHWCLNIPLYRSIPARLFVTNDHVRCFLVGLFFSSPFTRLANDVQILDRLIVSLSLCQMLGHTVSISVLISRVAMRRVRTLVLCVFYWEKIFICRF